MNQKELNLKQNLLLTLILVIGFVYSCLLLTLVRQTYSGFVMQLIFLGDSFKNSHLTVFDLVFSQSFIFNFTFGLLAIHLTIKWIRALHLLLKRLTSTQKNIKKLKAVLDDRGFYLVKDSSPIAFTAGLFRPKIFLSQGLLAKHTEKEINAILFHEKKHQLNSDPLKQLLVEFVANILPSLPKKDWLFGYYSTVSEINCDYYSQNSTSDKISLISALAKSHSSPDFLSPASYFSSQSERINILVGKRKLLLAPLITTNSFLLALLLVGHLYLSNTNPFYVCSHLADCAKILLITKPQPQLSEPSVPISVTQHCNDF